MPASSAEGGGAPVTSRGGPGDRADQGLRELVVHDVQAPAQKGYAANGAERTAHGGTLNVAHAGKEAEDGVGGSQREKAVTKATATASLSPPPRSSASPSPRTGGLVLGSVGRDLAFEATLVEKLGRLVCEGALIEIIDVHKEVGARAWRDWIPF